VANAAPPIPCEYTVLVPVQMAAKPAVLVSCENVTYTSLPWVKVSAVLVHPGLWYVLANACANTT
jgi:hypothetical protein